ncbi:MAG: hypothetical protein NTX53_08505 [candidate division WOR-3 bacterium]|nr:hypothetical protein [candidate division WOR-3 bacterium]
MLDQPAAGDNLVVRVGGDDDDTFVRFEKQRVETESGKAAGSR